MITSSVKVRMVHQKNSEEIYKTLNRIRPKEEPSARKLLSLPKNFKIKIETVIREYTASAGVRNSELGTLKDKRRTSVEIVLMRIFGTENIYYLNDPIISLI